MLRNVIVLVCSQIIVSLAGLSIPPLLPFMQTELKLSYTELGSIMSFLYFGALLVSIPAGWLTDKYGIDKAISISQVWIGIFTIILGVARQYSFAIFVAVLMGCGYGMMNPPTTKGITMLTKRRAISMSLKQTGVPAGGAIAAGILPIVALNYSWRVAVISTGFFVVLAGVLSYFIYNDEGGETIRSLLPNRGYREVIGMIFQDKNCLLLATGGALCSFVQIALITYIVIYLMEVKELNLVSATLGLAIVNIGGIIGRMFWGIISDLVFKGMRKRSLTLLVIISCGCSLSLACDVIPLGAVLYMLLFVFGFSAVGWNGVYHAFVGEIADRGAIGSVVGICMAIVFGGNLLGPVIFGKVVGLSESFSAGWYLLCGVMFGAGVTFSMIKENGKQGANLPENPIGS